MWNSKKRGWGGSRNNKHIHIETGLYRGWGGGNYTCLRTLKIKPFPSLYIFNCKNKSLIIYMLSVLTIKAVSYYLKLSISRYFGTKINSCRTL